MNSFVSWIQQLEFGGMFSTMLIVAASLICITIHETSHGLAAYWLGDPTAKQAGRLTLNPLRHVDIMGLVMMAVVKFGWAKPVPVNMSYFKNPKRGMAITAVAGPLSNVILAWIALVIRSTVLFFVIQNPDSAFLVTFLEFAEYVALISIGLAVFNLFPIPPLDGSKILFALLPNGLYNKLMQYERFGMIALMVALFAGVLDKPLFYMRDVLLDVLQPLAMFPLEILLKFFG